MRRIFVFMIVKRMREAVFSDVVRVLLEQQ